MYSDSMSCAGKHTVFGKVLEGMDVVKKIEAVGNPMDGQPSKKVTIVESGQLA
jgi:peptidylprolyl isomerase